MSHENNPESTDAPARGKKSAFAQIASEANFSVSDAIGGPRGMIESTVPGVVFIVVYAATHRLGPSLWAAVGSAALFVVARLVARQRLGPAINGLVGIALCALLARFTGQARDVFVWGIITNIGFFLGYLISILVRWPLLGVIVGLVTGEGMAWRNDPRQRRAYTLASWLWVGLFGVRLAFQLPLYLTNQVGKLGIARTVLGVPLFALVAYLSWLIVRPTLPSHRQEK